VSDDDPEAAVRRKNAYAAGRTRLYVAMAEDVTGWALTAITTHETDWGPCSSD
jgi:hypothetical protein